MENKRTFIDDLRDKMLPMKELLSLLEQQVKFIDADLLSKTRSDRDKNSDKILKIKTLQEIQTLRNILREKEEYYSKYAKQFEIDLADANKNWDDVIKKAWLVAKKNNVLMQLMKNANFDEAKTNDESKVIMYTKLKKFI